MDPSEVPAQKTSMFLPDLTDTIGFCVRYQSENTKPISLNPLNVLVTATHMRTESRTPNLDQCAGMPGYEEVTIRMGLLEVVRLGKTFRVSVS